MIKHHREIYCSISGFLISCSPFSGTPNFKSILVSTTTIIYNHCPDAAWATLNAVAQFPGLLNMKCSTGGSFDLRYKSDNYFNYIRRGKLAVKEGPKGARFYCVHVNVVSGFI